MQKDLHKQPFDSGTTQKLEIFEAYTKAWLPTFIMTPYEKEIWIMDLFAGPGYSKAGQEGSPIRILRQVEKQVGNIFSQGKKVCIVFNEYDKEKYSKLQKSCEEFCKAHSELKRAIEYGKVIYNVTNRDVATLFPRVADKFLNQFPLLLFLDQNGVKFMADSYLQPLLKAKKVDFLFYLSSSFIKRFGATNEFSHIIKIDLEKANAYPYKYFHIAILEQLRERIPSNSRCRLYPFTIKKRSNVYGIIFGSSHPLGVDKFLDTAWHENAINGMANFDIDDDCSKGQVDLWGNKDLTKIEKFQHDLREAILDGRIKNNKDAYDFTLDHGHHPSHAAEELKRLKKEKKINFDCTSPLVNYNNVYKKQKIINYTVLCGQQK